MKLRSEEIWVPGTDLAGPEADPERNECRKNLKYFFQKIWCAGNKQYLNQYSRCHDYLIDFLRVAELPNLSDYHCASPLKKYLPVWQGHEHGFDERWVFWPVLDKEPIIQDGPDGKIAELFHDKSWAGTIVRIKGTASDMCVLMPRGHLKSTIATGAHTLWELICDPSLRFLLRSQTHPLAKRLLTSIKSQFHNPAFIRLFGDLGPPLKRERVWSEEAIQLKCKVLRGPEPSVECCGLGTEITGKHADRVKCDDVVGEQNVNTPEARQKVKEQIENLDSVLDPGSKFIDIGTIWSDDDAHREYIRREGRSYKSTSFIVASVRQADGSPLWPEKFTEHEIQRHETKQSPYFFACSPAGSPVLMADCSVKPIEQVAPGDAVMGFDPADQNRLKPSRVLAARSRLAPIQNMTLESGKIIRCTPDHKWYFGTHSRNTPNGYILKAVYRPAKVGQKLQRICEVKPSADLATWGYLAGIIDGEGTCRNSSVWITQSLDKNTAVCKRIEETLRAVGYDFGVWRDERKKTANTYWVRDSWQFRFDLLRFGRPAKAQQLLDRIFTTRRTVKFLDRVNSIRPDGEGQVYSLETETGNYIVHGYASSNCQYMNQPLAANTQTLKEDWIKFSEYTPEAVVQDQSLSVFVTCDPATSLRKKSDYSACIVQGQDIYGKRYILDGFRDKLGPEELPDALAALIMKWQKLAHRAGTSFRFGIESYGFASYIQPALRDALIRRGGTCYVEELKHNFKAKSDRIGVLAGPYSMGQVIWPRHLPKVDHLNKPYDLIELLRGEYTHFSPRSMWHDDLLDAQAFGEAFLSPVDLPAAPQEAEVVHDPSRYTRAEVEEEHDEPARSGRYFDEPGTYRRGDVSGRVRYGRYRQDR